MAENPKKNLLISQKKLGGVNSKLNPVDRVQSANDDTAGFSNIERIKAGERKTDRSMPAAASHYQNILSVVMRREGILEGIYEHLGRIKKLVIDAINATLSKADKVNIQGEIDFYLDQISRECAELPQLAEGDARSDQPGALDAESLAALSKKIDLGYLGLDKGICVTGEVPSYTLNAPLVETALEKVHWDRAQLGEMKRKIITMVQTLTSGQHLAGGADRSSSDAMSDIVNRQPESPLSKAALERLFRDNEETIKLIR